MAAAFSRRPAAFSRRPAAGCRGCLHALFSASRLNVGTAPRRILSAKCKDAADGHDIDILDPLRNSPQVGVGQMGKLTSKWIRIGVGVIAWMIAGVMLFLWLNGYLFAPHSDGRRVAGDLWGFASAQRRVVRIQLDGNWLIDVGDPIFCVHGPDDIEQVGEIRRVYDAQSAEAMHAPGPVAEALLYPHAPVLCDRTHLIYYTTPRSMSWVMETMLSPEKRIRIAEEIVYAYEAYHTEIVGALKPVVVGGFFDALEVVEQDLATAVTHRRKELENLGSRYQDHVVEEDIVPLVRQEIWPIVRRRTEPLANQIGEEMFERASLWRFGWRLLYDRSFLPEKNLMQEEWNRFVREEGLPVLDRHSSDIVSVQRQILEDLADNQEVRAPCVAI